MFRVRVLALVVLLGGCAQSVPLINTESGDAGLGSRDVGDRQVQSIIGRFHVSIDLVALESRVSVQSPRAGSEVTMSEVFNLDVTPFLDSFHPDDFRITGLSIPIPTVLQVDYETRHPWPGLNLGAPLCGAPEDDFRADLAATGRVLWLVDDPDPETYFASSDSVRVNTRLVQNPDGYFQPRGLLEDAGTFNANAFPYQLLVDESLDNRAGVSNGGFPTGNYPWDVDDYLDPTWGGGITGFDMWGQGERTVHSLLLDMTELAATTFDLDVAILVKYTDPRGGDDACEKRENRLPCGTNACTGQPRRMAYYLPHAALDVGLIKDVAVVGSFQIGVPSGPTISAAIRDWDAGATEMTFPHLSQESDLSLVWTGEAGLPTVDIDLPGIASDFLAHNGGSETGIADDELIFDGTLLAVATGPAGTYRGLIRARDMVDVAPPADWAEWHQSLPIGTAANVEGATYMSLSASVVP